VSAQPSERAQAIANSIEGHAYDCVLSRGNLEPEDCCTCEHNGQRWQAALSIDAAIREAVEEDRRSGPETVTFTLDREGTELTFIIGVDGYFNISDLQEIEQEVRANIGDYYDPEFADAGGQAIEKFTVQRVNMHPDDGGGYWELTPFISVMETPEADKIENLIRARSAQEGK